MRHQITNEAGKQKIRDLIGDNKPVLEVARRRKLKWFGHTTKRRPGLLAHDAMHGLVEYAIRGRGRPKKTWINGIAEWTRTGITSCLREAEDRQKWRKIFELSKCTNGRQRLRE